MYRLIYKSRSIGKVDWDFVNEILGSSQEYNSEQDVSGVLLATNTHFLQVLEGSFDDVNEIFSRIALDKRHEKMQLISFTCVEKRLFKNWAMNGIGVFDFNMELARQLKITYGEEDGEVRFPTEEWQVLSLISDIRMVNG